MQRLPQDDLREALTILGTNNGIDNQTALRFKQKLAQHFREQLMLGTPTNADEMGLRRLAVQLKAQAKSSLNCFSDIHSTPSYICYSALTPLAQQSAISGVAT